MSDINVDTPGASGANPTATASDVAVNGSAVTFMRSDAAPAVQKASNSQFGIVEVDGTTISSAAGVISVIGSSSFGGNWVPLFNGVEPPAEITDGAGNVIFVWYNP